MIICFLVYIKEALKSSRFDVRHSTTKIVCSSIKQWKTTNIPHYLFYSLYSILCKYNHTGVPPSRKRTQASSPLWPIVDSGLGTKQFASSSLDCVRYIPCSYRAIRLLGFLRGSRVDLHIMAQYKNYVKNIFSNWTIGPSQKFVKKCFQTGGICEWWNIKMAFLTNT